MEIGLKLRKPALIIVGYGASSTGNILIFSQPTQRVCCRLTQSSRS